MEYSKILRNDPASRLCGRSQIPQIISPSFWQEINGFQGPKIKTHRSYQLSAFFSCNWVLLIPLSQLHVGRIWLCFVGLAIIQLAVSKILSHTFLDVMVLFIFLILSCYVVHSGTCNLSAPTGKNVENFKWMDARSLQGYIGI